MPSTTTMVVLGASVVVAGAAGVLLYLGAAKTKTKGKGKSRRAQKKSTPGASGSEKKHVNQSSLVAMFDEIIEQMKNVKISLEKWKANVRRDVASKGAQVSDEEIDQMIQHHFAEQMKGVEAKIYEKHMVEKAEVEKACDKYQDQPEYKKKVMELQQLFDSISAPPAAPPGASLVNKLPVGVTLDLVCQVVQESMTAVHKYVYQGLIKEIQEKLPGVEKTDPRYQKAFYVEYQKRAPEKQQEVLEEKLGDFAKEVTDDQGGAVTALQVFQASILKYQADPEFQRRMKAVEAKQASLFQEGQAQESGGAAAAAQ